MKPAVEKEKKIQAYNFKRPDRISKNQLRSLHFIHDRFARNFSSSISAYLRTVVEISLEDTSQVSYVDFLAGASDPTCYAAISLRPLDGSAAVEIGPEIIFPMLDRLLGGAGDPLQSVRPMTEIEQKIVQNVLRIFVDNLKESWKPVYPLDCALTATETHPHLVQVVAPNEMVIHFKFHVRMREAISKMHLALPLLVLEPISHIFDQELYSRKKIIRDGTLLTQLRHTGVNISLETAETQFPMESLLSLQVGDTLVLAQRQEWPVHLKVAGKTKLYAQASKDARKKAFCITGHHRLLQTEEPVYEHNASR
jgi:flagellar motor switch protein FliM